MNINLTCRMCGEPTGPGEDYCDEVCAAGAGKAPPPERVPLTRERARAWIRKEWERLNAIPLDEITDEESARWGLLWHRTVQVDALADMLVDAAAGRIK